MVWALWDSTSKRLLARAQSLPPSLQGRTTEQVAQLGYRPLVTRHPEDYIPRFQSLLGSAQFEELPDGRIREYFPDADFSVDAVRRELVRLVKRHANQALSTSDWYFIRKVDTGVAVPLDVLELRQKIRDHVVWLEADIAQQPPRALVDYRWVFPERADQVMVNGLPVIFQVLPPPPLPVGAPAPPAPEQPYEPTQAELGNEDPSKVEPSPPPPAPILLDEPPTTTDGPVPDLALDTPAFTEFTADGVPLVTVYAPNVPEDQMGPRPDNNQETP